VLSYQINKIGFWPFLFTQTHQIDWIFSLKKQIPYPPGGSMPTAESLRQPLVLNIEDAQYLDEDSLAFLQRLLRDIAAYPLAILATARPRDWARFHLTKTN
jgi:hypothetical protein